jgi:transposase
MKNDTSLVARIGLDWSDRRHEALLQECGSESIEEITLEQKPEAIHDWVNQLRQRFGGKPVGLALEQSRGPLIYALLQYDFLVLYPINPKSFAAYREAFRISGAKDDPSDAGLLLDLLSKHQTQLVAWQPDDADTRALRLLAEQRRKLVHEQTRQLNRLKSLLKEYYPQILEWFSDLTHSQVGAFLLRWPTLEKVQRVQKATLVRFFHQYRCVGDRAQEKIQRIRQAVALTEDEAVMKVHPLVVESVLAQLKALREGIIRLETQIDALMQTHPDAEIFQSFPGAGSNLAPRILSAFGSDRERFDADRMQCFSGIAPVTKQSGNSCWVHHRYICSKFLKQTFHEFAQRSIPHSKWAQAFYHMKREEGKTQHQAIRALAYKWIRILTSCWRKRTTYCEETYIEALRKANSPVFKRLQEAEAA